jgi:prepilin-type N-terminal cleavage/methylation domain-containing protein
MKTLSNKKGFTLIEVVLVLAIAGLIMLIVFLALSGAQKGRRDTARKSDAGRIISAMEQYASNTSGTYATAALPASYLSNIKDPTSGSAPVYGTTAPTSGNMVYEYSSGQKCSGAGMAGGGANQVAVLYWSETAGAVVCVDNQ